MAHMFPSEAWASAYHQAVNDNPHYKTAGKDWTHGKVALVVRADTSIGIERDMAILLDVNAGFCSGASYVTAESARESAAFAVEGPYDNWKQLIIENQDPIKALMQGKLKLTKGHLPTMIRYVESSKQLLSSAQGVTTEFPALMGTLDYAARIELSGNAEQNGLANMVAGLILQNLTEHPRKRADFARMRGRIAIVAEDAGVALTLTFEGNMLTVHDGIAGIPDVTVRANGDDIVQMSLLELTSIGALPNLRGQAAREIVRKSREGQVRVYGALLHLPLVLRLSRLLSIN